LIKTPYRARIETGKRPGDIKLHAQLAKHLTIRIEALLDQPS
jgi:hypothetical protein